MKICIIGTGYVGLVSGVCLAIKGHHVYCVDSNPSIINKLSNAEPTIHEKGLTELLKEAHDSGRFIATTDLTRALDEVDLAVIAVGTPSKNGEIDLQYVRKVSSDIGNYLKNKDRHISIVVKSTVIPGTTDTVVRHEIELASGKPFGKFGLGMNPEFLREGEAIEDFMNPDRIILGYEDDLTRIRLEELYKVWDVDKVRVNTRTAELIKYANNAILATLISTVNEIANLAGALGGIDILDVINGVQLDKRWSPIINNNRIFPQILTYLVPGCGFGGSCFPKDVQALRTQGEKIGLPMNIINAVLDVNASQPDQVTELIKQEIGNVCGRTFLMMGLSFKPGTDDVRESASIKIVESLVKMGGIVIAHDPVAVENFKNVVEDIAQKITFVDDWESQVDAAEIVIVATSWPEYEKLADMNLSGKLLFDARRMFTSKTIVGANYVTIGRRLDFNFNVSSESLTILPG
jgi:UDPglucose 6-dehydrogenase/GDP-mannose 6-dehydrogenase